MNVHRGVPHAVNVLSSSGSTSACAVVLVRLLRITCDVVLKKLRFVELRNALFGVMLRCVWLMVADDAIVVFAIEILPLPLAKVTLVKFVETGVEVCSHVRFVIAVTFLKIISFPVMLIAMH